MAEALQLVLEMNEWTWQRCMDLLPRACDFYVKAMVTRTWCVLACQPVLCYRPSAFDRRPSLTALGRDAAHEV
jgi:hypothetical protein